MKEQNTGSLALPVEPAVSNSTAGTRPFAQDLRFNSPIQSSLDSNIGSISFRVVVNYSRRLERLIADGEYAWANSDICTKRFPVAGKGAVELEFRLIGLDRVVETEAVESELRNRSLRPATLQELLAYGAICRDMHSQFPLVALGSSWQHPCGGHRVPFIWTGRSGRLLDLCWRENRWEEDFHFLAIRT
jgi:hypothetical protein